MPDQIIIVPAWPVMDDLNNIVLKKKAVAQGRENSFLLLEEPLQNINQPLDRWEWQLIINTPQGRYQARIKPPSRLYQRLEETTCEHAYINTEPRKGWR